MSPTSILATRTDLELALYISNFQVIHGFISPKCVIIDKTKSGMQAAERQAGASPSCLKTWLVGWSNAADLEMLRTRPIAMNSLKDLTVRRIQLHHSAGTLTTRAIKARYDPYSCIRKSSLAWLPLKKIIHNGFET